MSIPPVDFVHPAMGWREKTSILYFLYHTIAGKKKRKIWQVFRNAYGAGLKKKKSSAGKAGFLNYLSICDIRIRDISHNYCLNENRLFRQSLRPAQILILKIQRVFLRLKFSQSLTLTKNPGFPSGTNCGMAVFCAALFGHGFAGRPAFRMGDVVCRLQHVSLQIKSLENNGEV